MIKNYIEVKRTARYFQSKVVDDKVKHIVFVLHGYAQNADEFLESFDNLASDEVLIVAPEGLSKFYWKDFSSNPTSSWMTSLERENEIKDTINYLNEVVTQIVKSSLSKGIEFHLLGFSQGGAAASRFIAQSIFSFKNLFLYAGNLAPDIDWKKFQKYHQDLHLHLIYGTEDLFVKEEQVATAKAFIEEKNFKTSIFKFNGKHKIEAVAIKYIKENLN